MDLKATGKTALVSFCLRAQPQIASRRRTQRNEDAAVNFYINIITIILFFCFVNGICANLAKRNTKK